MAKCFEAARGNRQARFKINPPGILFNGEFLEVSDLFPFSYELELSKLVKMSNENLTQKIITLNLQLDDTEAKMRLEPKHMLTKAKIHHSVP